MTKGQEIVHVYAKLFQGIDTCQAFAYMIDDTHQVLHSSCHFSKAVV